VLALAAPLPLNVALAAPAAKAASPSAPAWVAHSNELAQILLQAQAPFQPEMASFFGVPGYDDKGVDLGPDVTTRYRAALGTAQINLRFATVPAPITGRIGRSLATEGALATTNQADPLAVISATDTVFVDIQQSSADMLALRRALAGGGALPSGAVVRLTMEDGSPYGPTGSIQFSEVTVNAATGTVTLRAQFPNPQGQLMPGMFVQATFDQAIEPNAYLVPQPALQRDIGGEAFVYVVGAGNKVERRTVTADRTVGTNWVITAGLRPGDKVITQGTNNLKQGAPIKPVPANTPQRVGPPPGAGKGAGQGGAHPGAAGN
jgi:membrane fusion protein (multidrug efflux system)